MAQLAKSTSGDGESVAKLKKLQTLETLQQPLFSQITEILPPLCDIAIALFSLNEAAQPWVKSNYGLNGLSEAPDDISLCLTAISQNQLLETPAAHDNTRFHSGAPLILPSGERVGTLCIVAEASQTLNQTQRKMLTALANIAVAALVSRQSIVTAAEEKSSILSSIVEFSGDAIISKSLEGFILTWNRGAERLFGYSANEIIGRHVTCLFPDNLFAEEEMLLKEIRAGKTVNNFETQRITRNGEVIDVSITLSPIENADGQLTGVSNITRDIRTQKQLQTMLQEEHERRRVTMDAIGDAVITIDQSGNIDYLNPAAERITGWQLDAAMGLPVEKVFNVVNESTRQPYLEPIETCILKKQPIIVSELTLLISRDGNEYAVEYSTAPIFGQNKTLLGAIIVSNDVTEQRHHVNQINYQASHDPLTGLANRGAFELKLEEAMAGSRKNKQEHALLYIDLDQFKVVNDSSGHSAGDKLLKEITIVMSGCIRNNDTFARIGGDEFGILLEKCNVDNAMIIAQNICKSVDEYRFIADKRRHRVGASVGLVMIDDNWLSIKHLLQSADQACYAAKTNGRNRVHLYLDKDYTIQNQIGEVHWASSIEQAIEDNSFVLYCQRIMPLNGKSGTHGEILIRLKDENGKLIPPGAFLPAAERYHLASRIDRWVVREVFSWLKSHQKSLKHIETISINLSGQSLGDRNFSEYVLELIRKTGVDCSQLCFEITETAAITNINVAEKFIDSMKKHGIRFSLDDFGSGVSSFGYLKKLNVDYIKIDGLFIKDLTSNPIDQATVRCIAEIATVTGKKTIAEWVETKQTEDMLKTIGINYTQGFLRHKPAPLEYMLQTECVHNTATT